MPTKRDIDYSLRYALIFDSKKQRAALERIARLDERSLNYILNRAIDEYVAARALADRTEGDK